MSHVTLRILAAELKVSVATVSYALRGDPRVKEATAALIRQHAKERGYSADPIVSEGLSRARRREFYRETLGWILETPRERMPWLEPLFVSSFDMAKTLGYAVEFAVVPDIHSKQLARTCRTWKARGVNGVLLGPFLQARNDLPLPWDDFVWMAVGASVARPQLHRSVVDYDGDLVKALAWLKARGCRRIAFIEEPELNHLLSLPLLRAALVENHVLGRRTFNSYYELDFDDEEAFVTWLKQGRPDGLVIARDPRHWPERFHRHVIQSAIPFAIASLGSDQRKSFPGFLPNYPVLGRSAINKLHRLILDDDRGVPPYPQTAAVGSIWRENRVVE